MQLMYVLLAAYFGKSLTLKNKKEEDVKSYLFLGNIKMFEST